MLCTMCMHEIRANRAWVHCGDWHCPHILNCPHCGVRRYVAKVYREEAKP